MQFTADVRNGRVLWTDPQAKEAHIRSLENKRARITIEEWRPRRSEQQSRYYWGVCIKMISQHSDFDGWDPEDIHEWLKTEFLTREFCGKTFPRSTSTLNTADMAAYLERVIRMAAERGIVIPDPE